MMQIAHDAREHLDHPLCWCQPVAIQLPTGAMLAHRDALDRALRVTQPMVRYWDASWQGRSMQEWGVATGHIVVLVVQIGMS